MSAQISRPIGVLAFASVLLASGAVAVPDTAFAADCLAAPNSSTPPNGHWYYRTDRASQKKCWYLGTVNQQLAHESASVTGTVSSLQPEEPTAPNSLASFREFMRQQKGGALSDQDVQKLYAEFLEWNRRAN
jgi:hypothetical protein